MKKMILLVVFAGAFSCFSSQAAGVYGNEIITWLGLDFTHLKYVNVHDAERIKPGDVSAKFFSDWNKLIVDERTKYNVAGALGRDNIAYNLGFTEQANDHIARDIFSDKLSDYQLLTMDSISSLVSEYDFHGKTGIGLMFFVEGMCKDKLEASMWVTFVDMGTHKVLRTQRMTGRAGGFGFRNFWAKCFYNVISDLRRDLKTGNKE